MEVEARSLLECRPFRFLESAKRHLLILFGRQHHRLETIGGANSPWRETRLRRFGIHCSDVVWAHKMRPWDSARFAVVVPQAKA